MRNIRISIAIIVTLLVSIGSVMVYSSSGVYAAQNFGDDLFFLKRYLSFLFVGFIAMILAMSFDYRKLQKWAKPLLLFSIVLLVCVLIPDLGYKSFGARRWFRLGNYNFQPSELIKIVMIIYTADFLSRKGNILKRLLEGFIPIVIVLCICCFLILKQPDLGNAILMVIVTLSMMFIAGVRGVYLGGVFLLAVPLVYFLIVRVPYRMRRIIAFMNPWEDAQGIGFQLSQSQIALGSGGLLGIGLGKSMQKLFYLPAAHTDFIFSIIGEEFGLFGTLFVIFLFMSFIWLGAKLVKRITNSFGYYLSAGIVIMIGLQAIVNIGVSIGIFPTKGLPLPFISYGGSALVLNLMIIGLLFNISRTEELG